MIQFHLIEHNSQEYHEALILRYIILRKPLDLNYNLQDIDDEKNQVHIVGKYEQRIICSASIICFKGYCKIRQVAVLPEMQKKGIGKQLIQFCEKYIHSNGHCRVELHSRLSVYDFYQKNGYKKYGEVFHEVNLPHIKMIKFLHECDELNLNV
jgi:predicted GNAT family N-acyltransferase